MKLSTHQNRNLRSAANVAVILSLLAVCIFNASQNAHYFDGFFANGAFQLLNPLRRIAAGQIPGTDFQVFHGLGLPYLHYPIFAAFGKDLYASEVARFAISNFLFLVSSYVVALAATRSMLISSMITAAFFAFAPEYLEYLIKPGGSLLGVRVGIAVLVSAALLVERPRLRIALFCFGCSSALIISTEQGLAVILAAISVSIVQLVIKRKSDLAVATFIAILAAISIFFLVAGNGAIALLRFNYKEVMLDQGWYFGGPPNPFGLEGLIALFEQTQFKVALAICFLSLGIVIRQILANGLSNKNLAAIFLIIYGSATLGSLLGYITYPNVQACLRAYILAAIVVSIKTSSKWGLSDIVAGFMLIGIVIIKSNGSPNPHDFSERKLMGVYLSQRWAAHNDAINEHVPIDRKIWSNYFGLIEGARGGFQSGSDYIIHALGPYKREKYIEDFLKVSPEWVRTDNTCSWYYGAWLLNENWPFFRQLYKQYSPVYSDTVGALFKKNVQQVTTSKQSQEHLIDLNGCFEKTANEDGLWEMHVSYDLVEGTQLPFLKKLPRYMIVPKYIRGEPLLPLYPVSVPPVGYPSNWSFPMRLRAGDSVSFCPNVRPNIGNSSLKFTSATSIKVEVGADVLNYLECKGRPQAYYKE